MRNLLTFVIVGMVLLLLAFTSYPFEPQHLLLLVIQIAIIAVAIVTFVVFVQAERDEILSRIARTQPNTVTWNRSFVLPVLLYAALPLLTVVATAFPLLGDLFSFLDPVLRIVK